MQLYMTHVCFMVLDVFREFQSEKLGVDIETVILLKKYQFQPFFAREREHENK